MIIGIDASRANIPDKTGTEWYAYHVIEELKKQIPADVEVRLYSKKALTGELAVLPENWSSHVLQWPIPLLWTQARLSLHMVFNSPDVLYIPTHTLPLVAPKKSVVVIHDVGFAHADQLYNDATIGGGSSLKKMLLRAAVRLVTLGRYTAREQEYHRFAVEHAKKHATRILTVSEFSKKEIMEYADVEPGRIAVVPNGFNTRGNVEKDTSAKKPYVLYIGRIERKKNSELLVNAFAQLVDSGYAGDLILAGKPGYGYEQVQNTIREHGLEDRVICPGYVEEEMLTSLLSGASVFVFPSAYEGFGIPVLEAMSAGVPVVCSDIPPLREVAADAAQFFDVSSAESLFSAIQKVLADKSLQVTLQKQGIKRAAEFSWQKTGQLTWQELERVLENSHNH
jgi:glycosyltransferase involved in cell wall biosynthesis